MPRSAFSNLKRRGAAYWWRRTVLLIGLAFSEKNSKSCEFSLFTKELDLARGRSAAMTAHSERLKMSLRMQVAQHGLDHESAAAIFTEEMRDYRNELVHLVAMWRASPALSRFSNSDDDLAVFQCLWNGIASDGLGVPRDWSFVERHFTRFGNEMKTRISSLLRDHPNLPDSIRGAVIARLQTHGLQASAFNIPIAADLIVQARAAAAKLARESSGLFNPSGVSSTNLIKCTAVPIMQSRPLA